MNRPTMLMILDGYGMNPSPYGNAIAAAKKPNIDRIFSKYPSTLLDASGKAVGLPEGQMGNSEVGHLNIGAGRIVYQELTKITKAIDEGIFFDNIPLNNAMNHVLNSEKSGLDASLHLFGLLSDGGVHSHINHLKALLKLALSKGITRVYVHCFMDGRDVPPTSGITYMEEIEQYMAELGLGHVGIVSGRYYAMDRDKRWERLRLAYDALTLGTGSKAATGCEAVKSSYADGKTDEFILPSICTGEQGQQYDCTLKDGDAVVMFNFRPDRAREITRAFTDESFDGFQREKTIKNLKYVCMTQYDETLTNVEIAFPPHRIENTLGEYISKLGLHQLRIAETEKYAHVTFFFNGGEETPNPLEDRILIPSPKVATYDMQPEMSAFLVTEQVLKEIDSDKYDLIILNFANADMVGHTGVFQAAVKAVEALDSCVSQIADKILACGGQILLTADHGNADTMLEKDGSIMTAHSTNKVPLVHISATPVTGFKDGGKLSDIAPTLLRLMGLDVPPEMTGNILI